MSFCVFANRKFILTSSRIFLALPGIICGFAIGELMRGNLTSYGYIATLVVIVSTLSAALSVFFPQRRDLKWLTCALLVGNIFANLLYLVIVIQAEPPMMSDEEFPTSQNLNLSTTSSEKNGNNSDIEVHGNRTNESFESNFDESHINGNKTGNGTSLNSNSDKESHIYPAGVKSPIALIVLAVFLLLNSTASYRLKVDTISVVDANAGGAVTGVGIEEGTELKPLSKSADHDEKENNGNGKNGGENSL